CARDFSSWKGRGYW
nr:immunoglobulin heavy chain junction region [Macaca mulatta]MOV88268.1 immunoglobulin heavy chain junction region [Macaca mulatta]MOV89218.1 immunoglobulin heavy chain junction region [Macaca mulatta]MOV92076.1 immunoglobulin heavy chain junction region [Macaca mulatta]